MPNHHKVTSGSKLPFDSSSLCTRHYTIVLSIRHPLWVAGLLLHCYTLAKSVLVLQCPMALRSWLTKPPPCTRYYVVVPPCLYHRLLMRPRCHMLYVKGLTNHPYLIELMPSSIDIAGRPGLPPQIATMWHFVPNLLLFSGLPFHWTRKLVLQFFLLITMVGWSNIFSASWSNYF